MNKKLLFTVLLIMLVTFGFSQTKEELEAQKTEKQATADAAQAEADALQAQIDALPGWRIGAFGTIGASLSGFSNWYAQGTPNNSSGSIGLSVNPYAKLDREKYFWYNQAQVNLSWVKFDDKDDPTDDDSFIDATDVFNISSLYGYKLTSKWAVSTLGEYRTTLLNNFNDPGYLDLGVGFTWTPLSDLVVVLHPLNYNIIFSDSDSVFVSSFGTKVLATYSKSIGSLDIKSTLSAFLSYKGSDYSNWTWTNSVGYKVFKDIGLGFEFGLRDNKQEALNYALATDTDASFDNIDNDLQTYWLFGLSYNF